MKLTAKDKYPEPEKDNDDAENNGFSDLPISKTLPQD
jgi:hypothetical protein